MMLFMNTATVETRRQLWEDALVRPGFNDLPASLVAELAEYLGQPVAEVTLRCRTAAAALAQAWHSAAPATLSDIAAFYQATDLYLYDLTWWHTLNVDDSALAQVEALETALAHHAGTALDFGSGIGSLGLLMARHGLTVTLADVNPRLHDYARWRFAQRKLTARFVQLAPADSQGDLPPLGTDTYDFISAVDVFEHLPNPRTVLCTLAAALRAGGTLFVHLPPAADAVHPMHLWHQPSVLLQHLAAAGLWLERATGPALVLRRGEAPRYTLNKGLALVSDQQGGVLLSARPLVALRLNRQAFQLLAALNGGSTATELAETRPELPLADVTGFLDSMVNRRLLVKHPPPLGNWPFVSIIVPAHGRPDATRACVESLLALDYMPGQLEVIIVDDASEPPLASTLAGLPVRLIRQETNIGQSAARNLAAAEARGEVLAFIDNDCVADPDWLRTLVAALDEPGVAIAGGRAVAPPPNGRVAAFEAVRSPLDMGIVGSEVGPGEIVAYMPSCNLVVRRGLALRIGGFDPNMLLGEDVDFIWRALHTGVLARYVPAGTVVHHHRVRLGALLRRRADYGSSEADLQHRHPVGRRVMVLPLVVIVLLIALVTAGIAWPVSVVLVALALGSIAVEIGQKLGRLRRAGTSLPARQVAGAVLHEHAAALYHLGANVARYYSLPLLAAGLLWPRLLLAWAILLLVPPIVDYRRLHPRLSLLEFVGLYWLELAAYQVGVWRGCLHRRTLRPLIPVLRLRR